MFVNTLLDGWLEWDTFRECFIIILIVTRVYNMCQHVMLIAIYFTFTDRHINLYYLEECRDSCIVDCAITSNITQYDHVACIQSSPHLLYHLLKHNNCLFINSYGMAQIHHFFSISLMSVPFYFWISIDRRLHQL